MCIIAYYKKGMKPTRERIEYMCLRNPDGVGVAYNDGKKVYFSKGLVNADGVLEFINAIRPHANEILFHARIATSGGISAAKCHPYPLTSNDARLDITRYTGRDPVVFHNGVFSLTPEIGKNDTQTFIKQSLAPLHKSDPSALKNGGFDSLITLATRGSRVAIMYPDGVRFFGTWETDDGGVLYSNTSYKPAPVYYGYRWDDDEYYYGGQKYNREWYTKHAAPRVKGMQDGTK